MTNSPILFFPSSREQRVWITVALCSFSFHLLFLLISAWWPSESTKKQSVKTGKIAVQTIALNPFSTRSSSQIQRQDSPVAQSTVSSTPKPSLPNPEPAPAPVKPIVTPISPPPITPVPKPTIRQPAKPTRPPSKQEPPKPSSPNPTIAQRQQVEAAAEQARQQAQLAKAEENLAKFSQTRDKRGSTTLKNDSSSLLPIGQLQIDAMTEEGNESLNGVLGSYEERVRAYLQVALRSPEHGSTTVRLTLKRTGRVMDAKIIASENRRNTQYFERTLPTLLFPPFGQELAEQETYTFSVTFKS